MAIVTKIDNATFHAAISTAANVVSVVVLHDFYGSCGSDQQRALAIIEQVAMHYAQYSLGSVNFFRGNKTDIVMIETDILNVQCTPSYFFYVGDGVNYAEYHRNNGPMSSEQIKFFIEQQRG